MMNRALSRHKNTPWLTHLLCWGLYILEEQATFYASYGHIVALERNLFYYSLNIGLFYLHLFVLAQTAGRQQPRYAIAVLLALGELVVVLALKFWGNLFFQELAVQQPEAYWRVVLWDLHRTLFFLALATLLWSIRHMSSLQKRALEAERDRLQSERDRALLEVQLSEVQSAYYQHQLNPHLLFNTLSLIYTDVAVLSEKAAKNVLLLSDILRFCLRDAKPNTRINLEEEIEQLKNLMEINRLRYGERFAVNLHVEGNTSNLQVIPLILLTLTENIFKHGLVTDAMRPASIDVKAVQPDLLHFQLRNWKKRQAKAPDEGLGLRNVRIRLENAYPERYRLDISDTDDLYELELVLNL